MFRHQPPAAMYLPFAALKEAFSPAKGCVERFERALESYLGVTACYTAASARAALYMLLRSLAVQRPDRSTVLLPAYTCPVLVKVVQDAGLQPLAIDISPLTFAFDKDQLADHLNAESLALIAVHPFGIPQPLDDLIAQAHEAGAFLIEDAAQALGARLQGRPVGTMGDFGLYSLGPGKPLSVAGGGVLCTRDEEQAGLLREAWERLPPESTPGSVRAMVRLVGLRLATHPRAWWLVARAGLLRWGQHPSSWRYARRRLTAPQARVGTALLAELDELNELRRRNALDIMTDLSALDFVHVPAPPPEAQSIYLRLPLILDSLERRERLHDRLAQAGIGAGRLYRQALPAIFPELDGPDWSGAAGLADRLLTLPTHHYLTAEDVAKMVSILRAG